MLTTAENQLMTRVGPRTPMGNLLRQYWVPALLSSEIEADGPARKVKLLGEDLVAFRVTSGSVGMVVPHCPHRGASLHFGRNEHEGLTCVYHGWKFDINGDCVDMPSEPAESNFKDKVKIASYHTSEMGGIIWVYMGPHELKPAIPQFEWARVPESHRLVNRWIQKNNYMQAVEGEIFRFLKDLNYTGIFFENGEVYSVSDFAEVPYRKPSMFHRNYMFHSKG